MTSPDLIADEVIHLRQALLSAGTPDEDRDVDTTRRIGQMLDFRDTYPALDNLADQRLDALARLAVRGTTPGEGCTVQVRDVYLTAVQDPAPCEHRYAVWRETPGPDPVRVGTAWLSTEPDSRGAYVVVLADGCSFHGWALADALLNAAAHLDRADRTRHDARRGAVQ